MINHPTTSNDLIHQRYRKQQALNSRETIFTAIDLKTNKTVVMKFWECNKGQTWKERDLLKREANKLEFLNIPGIPQHIDSFELDDKFVTVQSYIDAPSLQKHIKSGKVFSIEDIREIAQKVLEILILLQHKNPPVIHRNINTEQILLENTSMNSVGKVSLVGFNYIKNYFKDLDTLDNKNITLVESCNPATLEHFEGKETLNYDLNSLAVTLLYLLTGERPSQLSRRSLNHILNEIPHLGYYWKVWFKTMLEPDPKKRYKNAKEASQKLERTKIQVSDPNPPINLPANTKLKIKKNSDELRILLNESNIISSLISNVFILFMIGIFIPTIWLIFTYDLWAAIIISLIIICSIIQGTSKRELEISFQGLTLNKFIFKTKKIGQLSIPLENLSRLQVTEPYWKADSENGICKYPSQIIIWSGVQKHTLPTSGFSEPEIDWIAYEISQWLDLPIDRTKIPVYK